MTWLLRPYGEPRTYRIYLYLLLGLPLGILDFTIMVTGLSLGLGLIITLLGIPVLVLTLLIARSLATLERSLAFSLLDAPMPRRPFVHETSDGIFWKRLRDLFASRRTWAEIAFLLLRLPVGIADFTVAVTIVSLALSGVAMPIAAAAGAHSSIGPWEIHTFWQSLIYLPLTVIFGLAGPRLLLAWSALSRKLATSLLGLVEPYEMKLAVTEVLDRIGEADGFRILDELELRLGHGPFLTATRVEATLLALESIGHVSKRQNGGLTLYATTMASNS